MYLSKYIWHKYKGDYLKNKFNDRNQVDDKIVRRLYRWKVSIFSFKFFPFHGKNLYKYIKLLFKKNDYSRNH